MRALLNFPNGSLLRRAVRVRNSVKMCSTFGESSPPSAQAAASAMFAQESNERTGHLMTQQNAQQRTQEAQARREHLMELYDKKGCK